MAVSRGGVAFWVGCVRSPGGQGTGRSLGQALDVQPRLLSSAAWALAPPNSLRYQTPRPPVLQHPLHHASVPEDAWPASRGVCVLVRLGESDGVHTLLEVPVFAEGGAPRPSIFSFPLTTVDGCRRDDISVANPGSGAAAAAALSFRSLFEAERCPAPYKYGSTFYCFHCPAPHLASDRALGSRLKPETAGAPPTSTWLCSPGGRAEAGRAEAGRADRNEEEKLDLMFERLRVELPGFFMSNHDYSLYTPDLEFINGLANVHTRGRLLYQLSVSVWRLLCLCYYADARLDVLKLTKHSEDGSIRARWRIRGLPLHALLLRFYRRDKSSLYRSFDAFSTFYVGPDGLIHRHRVEKVMPAPPPVLPPVTSLLAGALVALGLQEHRPALNLLPPLLSSLRQSRD